MKIPYKKYIISRDKNLPTTGGFEMKTYAVHLKNVAALIMLCSILALLLPFCRITTEQQMISVSGADLLRAGMHAGYEYVSNGTLEEDYVIKEGLTWGSLKGTMQSIMEAQGIETKSDLKTVAVIVFVGILPVLLCFLAMVLTFFAMSKGAMILPTFFLLVTCVENAVILVNFLAIQKAVFSESISSTMQFSLLMGYYLFTILCGIALVILLMLWISGGFNKPESKNSDGRNWRKKDSKKRFARKKKPFRRKKRRRRKGRNSKKDRNKKSSRSSIKDKDEDDKSLEEDMGSASGKLAGISGIYQNVKFDLNETSGYKVILGTTKETVPFVEAGHAEGCGLKIEYNMDNKKYRIQSSTPQHILIKYNNGEQELLKNRDIKILEESVILYVEDTQHAIRLK